MEAGARLLDRFHSRGIRERAQPLPKQCTNMQKAREPLGPRTLWAI